MIRATLLLIGTVISLGCAPRASEHAVAEIGRVTGAAFNAAGARTVEFSVPDMMCPEGCGEKTKEILAEQPGAREVLVDFESKTATVAIDEGEFDADAAIAALVDHGFDRSTLKEATPPLAPPQGGGETHATSPAAGDSADP